jgi:ATP-dependent protease ClpP protease subunit
MERTIYITESIVPSTQAGEEKAPLVQRLTTEYHKIAQGSVKEPIKVLIDTPGGDLKTALYIYDLLRSSGAPIHTYAMSEVSSAGVLLLLAGDKRIAFPNSEIMTHTPFRSVSARVNEFESSQEFLNEQDRRYTKLFRERTKTSAKAFKKLHATTNFMWPEEAKKMGILTDIVEKYPSEFFAKIETTNPERHALLQETGIHMQNLIATIGELGNS